MNLSIIKNDLKSIIEMSDAPMNFLNKDYRMIDPKKDAFPICLVSIKNGGVVSLKDKEMYRRDIALTIVMLKPKITADYDQISKEIEERHIYNGAWFDTVRDYLTHPDFCPVEYNPQKRKRNFLKHGNMEMAQFQEFDGNLNGCYAEQATFSILSHKKNNFDCCSNFDKSLLKSKI